MLPEVERHYDRNQCECCAEFPGNISCLPLHYREGSKNRCMKVLWAACRITHGQMLPDFRRIQVQRKLIVTTVTVKAGK